MSKGTSRVISEALKSLEGLQISGIGRAADLVWIQFGELRRVPTWRGGWKRVGAYALHLQCPWRITRRGSILTASGDIYLQKEGAAKTLFDSRVRTIPLRKSPLKVLRSRADGLGGFKLLMGRGWELEVFPADSARADDPEWWRMFVPGGDLDHLVVSALGVEPAAVPWLRSRSRRRQTG